MQLAEKQKTKTKEKRKEVSVEKRRKATFRRSEIITSPFRPPLHSLATRLPFPTRSFSRMSFSYLPTKKVEIYSKMALSGWTFGYSTLQCIIIELFRHL